jgi:transcriptional regulator with XRE-family HTH domain
MGEQIQIGECIRQLRDSMGKTQADFGGEFNVNQSRISEWETASGRTEPSLEAWMKMAALALKHQPSLAPIFWNQTGIDSAFLFSLADALLKSGQPGAEPIFETVEAMLKERVGDQKALEQEGKVVMVPPYTEGPWKTLLGMPPMPMPADRIANVGSTFYMLATPGPARTGFAPGDLIVFDTSGASTRRLGLFLGRSVLIHFTRDTGVGRFVGESTTWRAGLYLGRLFSHRVHVVRGAEARNEGWIVLKKHDEGEGIHSDRRLSQSDAAPEGCNIIGRFIALFAGGYKGVPEEWMHGEDSLRKLAEITFAATRGSEH